MKIQKKTKIFILLGIVFILQLNLSAQDKIKDNFIGINPSVTAEPFYEKGEFDINIFPLVYQRVINNHFDFRITSILNLGVREDKNRLSIYGIELAVPYFLSQKGGNPSRGFLIAPILSLVRYSKEEHLNLGIWCEPGYNILMDKDYSLSIGLQFGATYFSYDNEQNKWREHIGVKIVFGKWF